MKRGPLILKKIINCCHQMFDSKAKMHQNRFLLGLGSAPDPTGEAYSTPLNPLAGFKGSTSKGKEGEGGREMEKEWKGKGRRKGEKEGKRGRETSCPGLGK